ncbi:hypothetical protein V6N13_053520 [Hibiscus sabdariffa]|uniref:Uncharacterized protein n=1 Tax=Hibiscus sabdariffa TaxID=183260 RepID=A0ABR2T837_9ROSI
MLRRLMMDGWGASRQHAVKLSEDRLQGPAIKAQSRVMIPLASMHKCKIKKSKEGVQVLAKEPLGRSKACMEQRRPNRP